MSGRFNDRLTEDGRRYAAKGEAFAAHWASHIDESKAAILRGADRALSRKAVILGASDAKEIPLQALCERFSAVCLVDIDMESMVRAQEALSPAARGRCVLERRDLTQGAIGRLLGDIDEVFATAAPEALSGGAFATALVDVLDGQVVELEDEEWLSEWRGSFVVSSLVMSQLRALPERVMSDSCETKFGRTLDDLSDSDLLRSRQSFGRRLQRQHISLIAELSRGQPIYLASDVRRELVMNRLSREQAQQLGERIALELSEMPWPDYVLARAPGPPGSGSFTAWITAQVGRGVINPERERDVIERFVGHAQRANPDVAVSLLDEPLATSFESLLRPLEECRRWTWIMDPLNYFRGGVHRVDAWLLTSGSTA